MKCVEMVLCACLSVYAHIYICCRVWYCLCYAHSLLLIWSHSNIESCTLSSIWIVASKSKLANFFLHYKWVFENNYLISNYLDKHLYHTNPFLSFTAWPSKKIEKRYSTRFLFNFTKDKTRVSNTVVFKEFEALSSKCAQRFI